MLPLASSPACTPAENLQISWVQPPFAFNTKKTRDRKTSSWRLGSWNVRSLLDARDWSDAVLGSGAVSGPAFRMTFRFRFRVRVRVRFVLNMAS